MSVEKQELGKLLFYCWAVAVEIIKIGYVTSCDCKAGGPFTGWFFEAFHHSPYSLWWTYKTVRFLAGPYSLLWWLLNLPGYFGYSVFFGYLLICDIAIFLLLARKSRLYALYFLTLTVWFTTYDPVDFWIVVFAVAGRYGAVWLVLSPLTKLPIGSELWTGNLSIWAWAFTSHDSFSGSENWGRYILLIAIWLVSFAFYLPKIWSKITGKVREEMHDPVPFDPERDNKKEVDIGMQNRPNEKQGEIGEVEKGRNKLDDVTVAGEVSQDEM